ncbi:MAG: hypothetical protein OXM03_02405, partial [Chloroflexota bacterium]|nr:hypothetical protein [Chloroflexota bacterium]
CALDSSVSQPRFRRNDEPTSAKRRLCHSYRIVGAFALAGALPLVLAACSMSGQPASPRATPTVTIEIQLLATATAVAPSAPEMRKRLTQECRRYGNCDEPTHWDALVLALEQRPLELPEMDPGDACQDPLIRSVEGYDFEVIGQGPVYSLFYLLIIRADKSLNAYEQDGWHWNKVVWARDPQYTGPIVIRGRQLDGPATLRFQWIKEGDPAPELAHSSLHVPPYSPGISRLTDGSGRWEEMMTWVVVRAPGCYSVQIDGTDFSTIIVFRVH